eukprot:scaffold14.g1133.t1
MCRCPGLTHGVVCVPVPAWVAAPANALTGSAAVIAAGSVLGAVLLAAAVYFGLTRTGLLGHVARLFVPATVTVVHNPLVRRPLTILSDDDLDLWRIAEADPGIAAVVGALGYGMGIKGGIARKVLKILHGTPEPASDDFDIDCIILGERGMTAEEQTELRKSVAGMQMGHLKLEPKDVMSKDGLKTYWVTRDICLNEVLLMRLTPCGPITLFYSADALEDARHNVIRSIPHALKSELAECWTLDGATPILSHKHVARTILRYFKGGGSGYLLDEPTWAYYRRNKLQPITIFQILKAVHADDVKYKAVVAHLIDVGLLAHSTVRAAGGFNGLWGATLAEVNERMAQYGGRLKLEELDAEAVERWIVQKKAEMRALPYRHREFAARTGYIPADEDALGLGLVTFPQQLIDYVEQEGGLWDPAHPEGAPPRGSPTSASGPGSQASSPVKLLRRISGSVAGGAGSGSNGAAEPAAAPGPAGPIAHALLDPGEVAPPSAQGSGPFGWLAAVGGALGLGGASKDVPGAGVAQRASGLTEPLLPPARLQPTPPSLVPSLVEALSCLSTGSRNDGGSQDIRFVPAQALVRNVPAVKQRLGMAWLLEAQVGKADIALEDDDAGHNEASLSKRKQAPSRYTSMETIVYMCRIAAAAWPLLVLSSLLIVLASHILNSATMGDAVNFGLQIRRLACVLLAYVLVNWLSNVVLQLYLRQAMQQLYTGLFKHVVFQDMTFYDGISTSELATRTGVDMMNIRVLVGYLVQKLVKGLTQVIAGCTLLVVFAGPVLGHHFGLLIGATIVASMVELMAISYVIRWRHRVARSMLGRLYGFAFDVFNSIQGVVAMALQRNFTVGILEIGGSALLQGATTVGTVYALVRYTAVVESGYVAISEAVARFYASYGSLEHVIDLHEKGQLTNNGKPPVLEALEREEAAEAQAAGGRRLSEAEEGALVGYRLTADRWVGGVRCRGVTYGYRDKPTHVLVSVDLELLPGDVVLVSGDTGSGRSTLAHVLHLDLTVGNGSVQFLTDQSTWLPFHPTSTDRYDMQQRMGYASPGACIDGIFFASVQENMVCGCSHGQQPSVGDCQEAAGIVGFDADVARLQDGYQTLIGEASRVDLAPTARLRLGMARLLLLGQPLLVVIDDADRFAGSVPAFAGEQGIWPPAAAEQVVARLRNLGAAVLLTVNSSSAAWLLTMLPARTRELVLEEGRLRPRA